SSPRVGVERSGEPRRRGQRDELRVDIRLRGRNDGAYHCAVVAHEKFERLPERAVRPADGHSLAIAQRGEIGGLDRRALRFPFPQRLYALMRPGPPVRRAPRAALIALTAAASPAPAGFVVARAPQAEPRVGFAQDRRKSPLLRRGNRFFGTGSFLRCADDDT